MSKKVILFVHGPRGCGKTRNADAIRHALNADAVFDCGQTNLSTRACVERVKAMEGSRIVMLAEVPVFLVSRLRRQDDLEVHEIPYESIQYAVHPDALKTLDLSALELRAIAAFHPGTSLTERAQMFATAEAIRLEIESGMEPGGAIDNALRTSPTGRRKDTGENVEVSGTQVLDRYPGKSDRWATPRLFPAAPTDFEVPHKKAHVRGVAHGATAYAMGLVEGMAIGDRYITLIVDGDEDAKQIFIDYPFINWDSGRIQVRTVSEVMMVGAEDKAALGYAEWVADVTPDNLKALLELDQWQHFVAVLSGFQFDRFTMEYSQ